MPVAWLVWEKSRLLGVYASEDVAEDRADTLRARIASALGRHGVDVRTERWEILHYPIENLEERRKVRRKVADAAKQWELLDEDAALLPVQDPAWDRYLMVPHQGRLWFPGFQFRARGEPFSAVQDVLPVLRGAGLSDSQIFLWFTTARVGGEPPANRPPLEPDQVVAAANERARRG